MSLILLEKLVEQPADVVFRAWTEAKSITSWFFSEAETDARPGGSYRIRWRSKSDPRLDHERHGNYLEFVPGERLAFDWQGDSGLMGSVTAVTVYLMPEDSGTRVRLIHVGWPAGTDGRRLRDAHREAWTFYLDNLARVLTDGPDLRQEKMDQKVFT